MTQPGVGPNTALAYVLTIGDVSRFPRGKQVASYLGLIPREESSGGRQKLGAISKQGNRLLRSLLVEAAQIAVRFDPGMKKQYLHRCSPEAERCGEGGSGAEISGTTLLDAAHAETVSRDRSHREQPAGAPGRRKLDRWIDWALSHPAWAVEKWKTKKPFPTFPPPRLRLRRDVRIEESWSRFGPNRWLVERSSTGG
jgi:Transposase IS116/IS110/IS902 family